MDTIIFANDLKIFELRIDTILRILLLHLL